MKRLSLGAMGVGLGSPVDGKKDEVKGKSLADIAENWRNRANENGIRVSSSEGEGDADDEGALVVRA